MSFLYCFCSPDVQLVLNKRFYRWRVRWQTRNLTRENTRRFNSSQVVPLSNKKHKFFLFSPKIWEKKLQFGKAIHFSNWSGQPQRDLWSEPHKLFIALFFHSTTLYALIEICVFSLAFYSSIVNEW